MQEYRQCPCGARVAADGMVRRCPACGRQVDSTWRVVYAEQPAAPQAPAARPQSAAPVQNRVPLQQRVPVGSPAAAPAVPAAEKPQRVAVSSPAAVQQPAAPQSAASAPQKPGAWQLDYFGRKLRIPPQDTVCLGRNSAGAEYFEGDMLVSRKHVYLWVNSAGQLLAEDRESLNGTFYTRNGQRSPMEHGVSVRLQEGDVLWLYDLPLKVEAVQ